MDLKLMAQKGLTHLTLSELHTCQSYYQRLFYALTRMNDNPNTESIKKWCSHYFSSLKTLLHQQWLHGENTQNNIIVTSHKNLTLKEAIEFDRYLFKALEGFVAIEIIQEEMRPYLYSQTLNLLYKNAAELHKIVNQVFDQKIDIDLPRVILMEENELIENVPLFTIHHARLSMANESEDSALQCIEIQREKRYEKLLSDAHDYVARESYAEAKETLKKVLNFKETALAYNLLSWCYSLEGELETAKSLCLKAIKVDPGHGAAYNDLGSYLLSQGEINESLKWFELAKNARQYQNREFAFINAGRAYMEKREFKKALKEFSLALTLAPENEALHTTVNELKETLNRSQIKKDATLPPPLF
jgi:Tfp pilus assembly protein PilF